MLEAALEYAGRGWFVVLLHSIVDGKCTCGRPDCRSPGKHPRTSHGLNDATTDKSVIKGWLERWPDSNIGVATGAGSGIVVIDIDPRHSGEVTLEHLQSQHADLPRTLTAMTGGGGTHYLLQHPGGQLPSSCGDEKRPGKLGAGVDFKGDGGYIVVAPSRHVSGGEYAWDVLDEHCLADVAPLPNWIAAKLTLTETVSGAVTVNGLPKIARDKRHEYLKERGIELWTLVGLCEPALQAALKAERDAVCESPAEKSDDEIDRLVDWIVKHKQQTRVEVREPWPDPVDMAHLEGDPDPDFRIEGYLALSAILLLIGFWKAGKTTWLIHVLRGFRGAVNAMGVTPANALLITEEHGNHWVRRTRQHDLAGVSVIVRPFRGRRPSLGDWISFMDHVVELVERDGFEVVIFDTITNLGPVEDENDAAKWIAALSPLNALTDLNVGVVLVHHSRKGDGEQGQAARGSGALPGFVDTIVELRRFKGDDPDDHRRVLRAYSRFEETPPEVVIELEEDGYVRLGTRKEVAKAGRLDKIAELLPGSEEDAVSPDDVAVRWQERFGGEAPGLSSLRADLKAGVQGQRWKRVGPGKRGDPFRYHLAVTEGAANG